MKTYLFSDQTPIENGSCKSWFWFAQRIFLNCHTHIFWASGDHVSWFWELEWIWEPQTCCLWKHLTNVARSVKQHTRLASAWRTSSRTSSPSPWPWWSLSHDGTKRSEGPGTKNSPHWAWWSSGLIAASDIIIDRCDHREVQIQWWSRGTRSLPKTTTSSKM